MMICMVPLRAEVQSDMDAYANAIAKVQKYCSVVSQIEIAPPEIVPDWYESAAGNVSAAGANAAAWNKTVVNNLIRVPKTIVQWKPVYRSKTAQIQRDMRALADHLPDTALRAGLAGKLSSLEDALSLQIAAINNNIETIEAYAGKFALDLENLGRVVQLAENDENTNADKVTEVKDAIADIEHRISQYDTWITVGEAMLAGGLAVMAILYTINPAIGTAFIVFGVVAAVGAVDIVALEICKSVAESKLNKKKKELNRYEQTAVSLSLIERTVKSALDSSAELVEAVHGMTKIWEKLRDFAVEVRSALENKKSALSREVLLAAADSLQAADDSAGCYFDLAEKLSALSFTHVEKNYEEPAA